MWVGMGDEGGGVQVIHTVAGQGGALLRDVVQASGCLCQHRIHAGICRSIEGGDAGVRDAALVCRHRVGACGEGWILLTPVLTSGVHRARNVTTAKREAPVS